MSKFKDAFNLATGRDSEGEAPRRVKKTGRKANQAATTPKRKNVATKDAILNAYDYAQTDQVKADLKEALRNGSLTDDLSKLLQVLFDRKAVRELVSTQGDVRPGPDEYYLDYRFVHPDSGDWCNEEAEELLDMGKTLEDLKKFNIEIRVVRRRQLDDEEIGEGTEDDYKEIIAQFEEAAH